MNVDERLIQIELELARRREAETLARLEAAEADARRLQAEHAKWRAQSGPPAPAPPRGGTPLRDAPPRRLPTAEEVAAMYRPEVDAVRELLDHGGYHS